MIRAALAGSTLAVHALQQRPARCALLLATLAVAVGAWLGLAALAAPFANAGASSPGTGVQVANARGSAGAVAAIPQRYAAQIARLPDARDVRWLDALPVSCGSTTTATLNAVGGPGADRYLDGDGIAPAVLARWNADPLGILVGARLARECGWHAGMVVSPHDPLLANRTVEIHISGVYHSRNGVHNGVAVAHYAYVNRIGSLAGRDQVLFIFAFPVRARGGNALAARIEALFAHADPPVIANTDAAAQSALGKFGRIQDVLALVMLAVACCALLVLVSVLAHAAAQRRREMAVMQVLGFPRGWLFVSFALEGLIVVALGCAAGIGLGLGALGALRSASPGFATLLLGGFRPPAWAWWWLPAWLAVLAALALASPALTIARLRPTDCRQE